MRKLFHCAFALAFAASLVACADDEPIGGEPDFTWEITMGVDLPKRDTIRFATLEEDNAIMSIDWGDDDKKTIERYAHYYDPGQYTIVMRGDGRLSFECSGIHLVELDVSKCPHLYELICPQNELTSLDVSNNPNLQILHCNDNMLKSIDLSANKELRTLALANNNLDSLDVSKSPWIQSLQCDDNPMTALRLGTQFDLSYLSIDGTLLSEEAYNEIFKLLPAKTEDEPGMISVDEGKGDISIAQDRHWMVLYPYDELSEW